MTLDLGNGRFFKFKFIIAAVYLAIIGADFLYRFGLILDFYNPKFFNIIL